MASKVNGPRISVSITHRQQKLLKDEADRLGLSLGELIRRVIDRWYQDRGVG